MKNDNEKRAERLLRSLSLADDKYVDEASPDTVAFQNSSRKTKHKRGFSKRVILIAAAVCLLISIIVTSVLIPLLRRDGVSSLPIIDPESADKAKLSNDYESFLEKLAAYKNKTGDIIIDSTAGDASPDEEGGVTESPVEDVVPEVNPDEDESYEEVTDNQTDGVIEADIIKRSNKYIYYFDYDILTLRVYSIDGEASSLVASHVLEKTDFASEQNGKLGFGKIEFFLTKDCKTAIFIANMYLHSSYQYHSKTFTSLVAFDVSDPQNITKKSSVTVSGAYVESRYVDGNILLVTSYTVYKPYIELTTPDTFLPQINGENIYGECIYSPEEIQNSNYTVISVIGEKDFEVKDTLAFISYYAYDLYASSENLYIWRGYSETVRDDETYKDRVSKTEISSISYAGGKLSLKGSVCVSGSIKDQYSLDEYGGALRVFTSSFENRYEMYDPEDVPASYEMFSSNVGFDRHYISKGKHVFCFENENANFYALRVKDFEFVAEIVGFAPEGENVKSARFEENTAYVCTSVDFSDPVFFFDLSDLENITYKDTGTIEGYSVSLISLGDGLLLGIGYGSNRSIFKAEIYKEGKNGVESVGVYEEHAEFSSEYKSYMIDRKEKLIGIPVYRNYNIQSGGVLLLSYENGTLEVKDFISVGEKSYIGYCRSVCIDGYLYVFANNGFFTVKKL